MRKINYPLIVSDFDGTLVKKDGTISEEDKKAILEYVEAGGKFAISTGRMPAGILARAKELGLKGMVCCCQGSIIMDIETNEVILQGRIPVETTVAISTASNIPPTSNQLQFRNVTIISRATAKSSTLIIGSPRFSKNFEKNPRFFSLIRVLSPYFSREAATAASFSPSISLFIFTSNVFFLKHMKAMLKKEYGKAL